MARRGAFAVLALAPLMVHAFRIRRRGPTSAAPPWVDECGAPPGASDDGTQPLCQSYQSKRLGSRHWIRGHVNHEKAHQGCYIFLYGSQNDFVVCQANEPQLYAPFFTREMANEGYCAVQVDYARPTVSQFLGLPFVATEKAEDVFGAHSYSALQVLNSIPGCDCSKRTVVHGHSQGGIIVSLAGRFSPWVDKILVYSGGCWAGIINTCGSVNRHEQLGLPQNATVSSEMRPQILVVGMQKDEVLGCGILDPAPTSISQYQTMSGEVCGQSTNCSGDVVTDCVGEKGTGYFVVTEDTKPARSFNNHNWFTQADDLNVENDALQAWPATYDVRRLLNGTPWWAGCTRGWGWAHAVNDAFRTSGLGNGWPASKRYLTS